MLHLVDGLLTLARGEEGTVVAERSPVDLGTLLRDVYEVGQALAAGKPVTLRLDLPQPIYVLGSAGPLRQVFLNLVSNAVKFTESGSITIGARRIPSPGTDNAPDGGFAEVWVRDTGVGIEPEELPRVFDRFYRGEAARGRPSGAGLGLAIARLIVEQHGGRIEVESEPGRGSEFRAVLPLASAAPGPPPPGITPGRAEGATTDVGMRP